MSISAILRQLSGLAVMLWAIPAWSQANSSQIDIDPEIIKASPVLQRWLQKIPDVGAEIQNDPSFRTRIRLGYSQYPANGQAGGWDASIKEVLLDRSGIQTNARSIQQHFSDTGIPATGLTIGWVLGVTYSNPRPKAGVVLNFGSHIGNLL